VKIPLIAAVGLILALGACGAPNSSVQWGGICSLPTDATQCTFTEKCDAQYIGNVELDLAVSRSLWLVVQLDNARTDNTVADTGHVNNAQAYVQEYEFEFGSGGATATTPVTSSVVPAAGTAVISMQVPFAGISASPGTVVSVLARARGVFGDGTKFETGQLQFPVTITTLGFPVCPPATPTLTGVCPPAFGQVPVSIACE
jgi:hypothetical protein